MKKETKRNAAQEKIELLKTGGGISVHKIVDPMHESVLTLMNIKTVKSYFYFILLHNKFNFFTIYVIKDLF